MPTNLKSQRIKSELIQDEKNNQINNETNFNNHTSHPFVLYKETILAQIILDDFLMNRLL